MHALRKYTKVYEVPGIGPQSSKEDLTSAVSKHWNTMVSCDGCESWFEEEGTGPSGEVLAVMPNSSPLAAPLRGPPCSACPELAYGPSTVSHPPFPPFP